MLYLFKIQYPHDSIVATTVRQETMTIVLKSECPAGRTWLKIHKRELECDASAPEIKSCSQEIDVGPNLAVALL